MPVVKSQPAHRISGPSSRDKASAVIRIERVIHLIPHARFKYGKHLRGRPSSQAVGAERTKAHTDEGSNDTNQHEGAVHCGNSSVLR